MATFLKGEKPGRNGSLSASREGVVYSINRTYYVISDTRSENELNVLTTTGLPVIGLTQLAGFPGTICRSLAPTQNQKQPRLWEVVATFSTETLDQTPPTISEGVLNPDPTTWVPIYAGDMQYYPEVLTEDFSTPKKLFVNYANCKFAEPLTIERPIIVYEFYQYEAPTITDKQIGDRNDKINDASVTRGSNVYPARSLKCSIPRFERGYFYGYEAVKIHYQIAYKPSLWEIAPLQVGYEYYTVAKTTPGATRTISTKLIALEADGTKRAEHLEPLANNKFLGHEPTSFSFLR